MANDKLVLIDGHALAYRVFYALPLEAFTTKEGEPTNATWGFTRTVLDLLFSPEPPKYLAVSFDVGLTFREELFAEYKGTRAKMPDELGTQIGRIHQVLRTFNIPILELEGFEADDVLGTVSKQAGRLGIPVHIITGDRDLLQLVDEYTIVELPPTPREKEPQRFDEAAVLAKYGVTPAQFVDYKALIGDKSDNIPGVRGIGETTAVKLLTEYGTLDNVYANLEQMKGALRTKLEEGRESAYLSHKLSQIVTDAPIQIDIKACVAQEYDPAEVLKLFRELEFRTFTDRLAKMVESGPEPIQEVRPGTEVTIVRTEKELRDLVKVLDKAAEISFDVETTSIDKMTAELVGVCLSVQEGQGYYIPVGHLEGTAQSTSGQMDLFAGAPTLAEGQLPLKKVLEAIRPALTNPKIGKIAHNAKYDYIVLDRHGVAVMPITFDTMIAEWLIDPASKHLGLKELSSHRLGVEMTHIESLIGTGKNQKTFAETPIEEAAKYGAADADMTLRLAHVLWPEIKRLGLERLLVEIEMPLIAVLSAMEQEGVGIDVEFFKVMSKELDQRMVELEKEIHQIAGHPFNINSTQQLSDVLFKEMKLPHEKLRKTSSGHFSTAADVLDSIEPLDSTGMIKLISEYRELGKLKSTYVDALPTMVHPKTNRIHTSLNQTGSVTGRIASNTPNLQNIPIRTEVGQKIRRGFISRPGWVFLAADYSQIELRILAHVTRDEALVEAFRQDQDIHRATAAAVYNIPFEAVTFNQRRFAKTVNFGIIYGMGAYRLARDSELTLAESEKYIADYFKQFPGIRQYLDKTKEQARRQGYVETLLGRRRYFPIFKVSGGSSNQQAEARAEREAINHPIQGTAADIVKYAMIQLHEKLTAKYQARMIVQVHDELLIEVPQEEVEEVKALVEEVMCNAFELSVPLKVEASVGRNWLEIKG
jgi:DNA polymerase-1